MMKKRENRQAVRQAVERAALRDEHNSIIKFSAMSPIKDVLKKRIRYLAALMRKV